MFFAMAFAAAGCARLAPRLYAPLQPDGWSAQPVAMERRFSSDAELDGATRTPVGDEGYYFYILTLAGRWDYGTSRAYLISHLRQPWGHSWIILESPEDRLECGLNGNFGRDTPSYDEGVRRLFRAGDPDPIAYLWETMPDGILELGNGGRTPTFVWQMPITRLAHQRIHEHVTQWAYGEIGVGSNNCVDWVMEAAALAGIRLIHRVRLTIPPTVTMMGKTRPLWTDPRYRIMEYSTPDVLEAELRHAARFGIGRDVTAGYRVSGRASDEAAGRRSR